MNNTQNKADNTLHKKNNSIPMGDLSNDIFTKISSDKGIGKRITNLANKSLSEPFKGTELEIPAKVVDDVTGWLDKKMSQWAGKKPEGGDKK